MKLGLWMKIIKLFGKINKKINMEKNKSDIMKQAIETYLENGGSMKFLKHFEQ